MMLEIKNVHVSYGKQEVLKGASVSIFKGEILSIIGANGCGKTTLLKSAAGIIPRSGEVIADGEPLCCGGGTAKRIAYLAQGRSAPGMTVGEMVLHGRFPYLSYPRRYSENDRRIAREAMESVGIAEHAERTVSELSGGMRQAAYIAMALAQGTDYILLDEPTTYLDVRHQLSLLHLLQKLAESGKGIAAVMHDLPLAFALSDKIAVMENGIAVAYGTPSEIYTHECIGRIFGIRLKKDEDGYRYVAGEG